MADDSKIAVELVAKVDQLNSGLAEAKAQVTGAVEQIKGDVHTLVETAQESEGTLKKILSGEMFVIFAEVAKEALEAIREGFEQTVVKAEEFGLSTAKFAAMMGTSQTEAAGLSAALRGVGSSAEAYESMAMRLEMRLQTNEKGMNQLGMSTRDANGNLLSGKELIDSAISTMQTYKSGTDQNSFALEVFGRRAADVYDIMRVGDEQVSRQIDIYKEFGVQLDGTAGASAEAEDVLNDLRTMFEAMGIAAGQQAMPVIKDFAKVFEVVVIPVFEATVETIKFLSVTFMSMGAIVDNVATVIKGVFIEIFDVLKGVGAQIYDALHGNWTAMKDDAAATWGEMKADAKEAAQSIADQWGVVQDMSNKLFGAAEEAPKANPYKSSGGTKSFKTPSKGGGAAKSPSAEFIKDDEKLAEDRLALETSTDEHIAAMGQETAEKLAEQKRDIENRSYAIKLDALQRELALSGHTVEQTEHLNAQIEQLGVTHAGAMLKIDQDAESSRAAVAKAQLANFLKADDERLKSGIAALQEEAALGQITMGERDAQERQLTTTIRQEQLARLDAELATLAPGTKAYEDVVKQRERVEKQFTADMKQENAQRAKDISANVSTWMTPITSGFKTAIKDMITSGKSFGDAMKQMGESMLSSFLDIILQMGERWVVMQVTNAAIAQSTQSALGVAQATSNSAIAATGAAASVAAIPIAGAAMAAPTAAATFAALMGTYAPLASAAGGMVLDRDRLVFAHNEEMILPAQLSQGLQRMVAGGGGGGNTFHYSPTIHAGANAPSLAQMIRNENSAFIAAITQANRDGKFRPRMT